MYNSIIRLCQISSRPQMPLFTLKKNGYLSAHPASGIRFAVHIDLISIVLTHVSTNHVPSYDERLKSNVVIIRHRILFLAIRILSPIDTAFLKPRADSSSAASFTAFSKPFNTL